MYKMNATAAKKPKSKDQKQTMLKKAMAKKYGKKTTAKTKDENSQGL
jgi:hypothetical protein